MSIICLVLMLLLVGCSKPLERAEVVKSNPVTEEYAVYSSLLNEFRNSPAYGRKVSLLVINDQTSDDKIMGHSPEKIFKDRNISLSDEFQAALKDYEAKNKESQLLTRSLDLKLDYLLTNYKELNALFKGKDGDDFWVAFYKKYPNSPGLIKLSKVGFDPEMKHAFIYVAITCGGTCGGGSYRLLTKEDGTWKVTRKIPIWVS